MTMDTKTERIKELNDQLRTRLIGGKIVMTSGVASEDELVQREILQAVMSFINFNGDNDPYGEHDFGMIEVKGQKYYWKIDYYDLKLEFGSEYPSDANLTRRVLTIMGVDEY